MQKRKKGSKIVFKCSIPILPPALHPTWPEPSPWNKLGVTCAQMLRGAGRHKLVPSGIRGRGTKYFMKHNCVETNVNLIFLREAQGPHQKMQVPTNHKPLVSNIFFHTYFNCEFPRHILTQKKHRHAEQSVSGWPKLE